MTTRCRIRRHGSPPPSARRHVSLWRDSAAFCLRVWGGRRSARGAAREASGRGRATTGCAFHIIFVRRISRTLTSCNCSICRRYGALWVYYAASSVTIEAPNGGLSKYSWNRKIRAYYRCKKCGCVTHYAYRTKRRNTTIAVNAVNFEPSALVGVRIRHLDGAASWKFLD
jgi:hypothetical protein